MIFYFSGTGNSYYIAKKISEALNERLISIAECVREGKYEVILEKDEKIGFVYPVHACAPADIVIHFIRTVQFINYEHNYMYSVFNCAGTYEYTSRIIKETCEKREFEIGGFFKVLMPGNYVTVKKHLPEEKCKKYLAEADDHINEIVKAVQAKTYNYKKEKHSFLLSYGLHKLAALEKETKFDVGEKCKGCG
ncbi:EFR1 family ferrodoxin [Cellulosilyticum ruminicola]|uniref:EFR1 family ferrodoxin n=1 Tax=Cellulosilyticum ruminicola TaxID=425254 RepID=UPI0006D006E0|nr:EFR1 family ferrodoxin [Cellulosilyticum ruminicola]